LSAASTKPEEANLDGVREALAARPSADVQNGGIKVDRLTGFDISRSPLVRHPEARRPSGGVANPAAPKPALILQGSIASPVSIPSRAALMESAAAVTAPPTGG